MNEQQDLSINEIKGRFNKAVSRRKWSMINEKIVPMVMPPALVSGGAFTALIGLWDHLPPQGQKMAVMAAGAASLLTTAYSLTNSFVRADKRPFANRKEAIRAIDDDIAAQETPAKKLDDEPSKGDSKPSQQIFELAQKRIWKEWAEKIESEKLGSGFGAYYKDNKPKAAIHTSILVATAITGGLYGDGAFSKFNEALHWQAPPPPLMYKAWITPPQNIDSAQGYLPDMIQHAIENQSVLDVHEGSTLYITTQERPGSITLNGGAIKPDDKQSATPPTTDSLAYQYTISFDGSHETIALNIEGHNLNFSVALDNPPSVTILGIKNDANNPTLNDLEYVLDDDYGITSAQLETGIQGENGSFKTSKLPSAQLPPIEAPISFAPLEP